MRLMTAILILCCAASAAAEEIRPGPGAVDFARAIGRWTCAADYHTTPITVAHRANAVTNIRAVLGGNVVRLDYQETSADQGFPMVSVLDHVWTNVDGTCARSFVDSNRGVHNGTCEVNGDNVLFAGDYRIVAPPALTFGFSEALTFTGDDSFTAVSSLDFTVIGLPLSLPFQTLTCNRVN